MNVSSPFSPQLNLFNQFLLSKFNEDIWSATRVGNAESDRNVNELVTDKSKTSNVCTSTDSNDGLSTNNENFGISNQNNGNSISASPSNESIATASASDNALTKAASAPTLSTSSSSSPSAAVAAAAHLIDSIATTLSGERNQCIRFEKRAPHESHSMESESVEDDSCTQSDRFDENLRRKRKQSSANSSNKRRNIERVTDSSRDYGDNDDGHDPIDAGSNGNTSDAANSCFSEEQSAEIMCKTGPSGAYDPMAAMPSVASARALFEQSFTGIDASAMAKDSGGYLSPIVKMALQSDENKLIGKCIRVSVYVCVCCASRQPTITNNHIRVNEMSDHYVHDDCDEKPN